MMVTVPSVPMKTQALALKLPAASAGSMPSNEPKVTATPAAPDDDQETAARERLRMDCHDQAPAAR